ncbi:hypothetical protein I3843_04G180600 [Carya illinoinensis]|nr:hypothetical protein I3843_04G180600 [Carya illinoinensis]
MDPVPVILDISSNKEMGLGEPWGSGYGGLDWLSKFLGCTNDKEPEDDSDDVVVVREVINAKRKLKPLKLSLRDADDDCGIARRDYPHPCHLCAKFPFSSTPHDRHCEQCHYFVYEPLRKTFKLGKNASLLLFKSASASLPTAPDPMPQKQVFRLNVIRACSTLPPYSVPSIISQGRSTLSISVLAKNRFHLSLISQHLFGVPVRGALPMHPSVSGSSGDINCAHAIQYTRNSTPATSTNDRILFGWPNPIAQSNVRQNFCPNGRENYCLHGYHGQIVRQGIYHNENQSLCQPGSQNKGATDASFSDFNMPTSLIYTGMLLFNFETSLNGLAHA